MLRAWVVLALLARTLAAEGSRGAVEGGVATTARAPPRTLDRQADELAWRTWLQSPESGNQNAPPRRITTKSLFITPLVCPKGQRLDRNGCVQVVTLDMDEHKSILLEQLNALFTSQPSGGELYDYGDSEPLQLSIPIGFEPQAAPLQANINAAGPEENYVKIDKKDKNQLDADSSIEAELENLKHHHGGLELSKLQQYNLSINNDTGPDKHFGSPSVLNNLLSYPDKPKRDSSVAIEATTTDLPDDGQKEVVFGQVNFDPYLNRQVYESTETSYTETDNTTPYEEITPTESKIQTTTETDDNKTLENERSPQLNTKTSNLHLTEDTKNYSIKGEVHELKKDVDKTKLNPENEYSDIGQAIKLISRYAEVTTDDNFSKDQKTYAGKDEGFLGTRTKVQHRRNKLKPTEVIEEPISTHTKSDIDNTGKLSSHSFYPKGGAYYRYPWVAQQFPTPPPDYPFRHLQDYWPGKNQIGGLYITPRENPRRHHHSFANNNNRNHGGYYPPPVLSPLGYPGSYLSSREVYPPQHVHPHGIVQHHAEPIHFYNSNQDLYSLLGLRHWFSSEGSAKR